MAKRLSDNQKEKIIKGFLNNQSLENLSKEFGYTKLTIVRHLKKNLGEEEFKNLLKRVNPIKSLNKEIEEKIYEDNHNMINPTSSLKLPKDNTNKAVKKDDFLIDSSFVEIAPLNFDIDNTSRKDLSSVPIEKIDFPKTVFMIVDKKIELETKLLKEYAEWQFLPENDLNSKTIEIYSDLKNAKRDCKKEQKVIKVPNTNVFKIVSKMLLARGITRIISDKQLISL